MGWEQRGNRRCYYCRRRQGGQVISEYVGAGEVGATTPALQLNIATHGGQQVNLLDADHTPG